MRYLVVLFCSHLAATSLATKSPLKQLTDLDSILKGHEDGVDSPLMPNMESANLSVDSDTIAEVMKLFRTVLLDALREQATDVNDGVLQNVQEADYRLKQSIKSMNPFNGESICLNDDLQELTNKLEIVLDLIPEAGDDPILNDDVLDACRTVVDGVYQKKHLIRSNVIPKTWKSFKDAGDRISAPKKSCSASEKC